MELHKNLYTLFLTFIVIFNSCITTSRLCYIPSDAVEYKNHKYKVFKEKISWHEAVKKCYGMGGYLVCIETEDEQRFIEKLAEGKTLWLGGTDEKKEGKWRWINGKSFNYSNWMETQPNNFKNEEHYLAIYEEGKWIDVKSSGNEFWMPVGYICEWEP